jgi:dTDP-4-dehydrorhamnose 3,5-epimerase
MDVRELSIPDTFEFTPRQHPDDRGVFLEWFKADVLEKAVGHRLTLTQANTSVSKRGTVRGVHFAQVPPSQAKYVTCTAGALLDVVVDLRLGSPMFGKWEAVRLDTVDRKALYVAEGLGHAFMALEDDTAISYLCSTGYSPGREHGITPLDPTLAIEWPIDVEPLLSPKDTEAPTLAAAEAAGLLATYDECQAFYAQLRTGG